MVLVDTSVWVDHFKCKNQELVELLENDKVLCHPLIVAEIACGTPPHRSQTLGDLKLLQPSIIATQNEVLNFIETNTLYGRGCGFIDLSLLASVILTTDAHLWTLDKSLALICHEFGRAHQS